jgi:hypothetical protein
MLYFLERNSRMPEETSFRLMDEKHVSVEVTFMLWSPKFDLIALANVQGEVIEKNTLSPWTQ